MITGLRPRSPATELNTHSVPPPRASRWRRASSQNSTVLAKSAVSTRGRESGLCLQPVLRREQPGGDDHGVEAAQHRVRAVERRPEIIRPLQIAGSGADGSFGPPGPDLDVTGAGGEIGGIPSQQEQPVSARGELPRQGPPDPLRRTQQDDLPDGLAHVRSPSKRTDCALRSFRFGSQMRRTRWNSSMRGSMARKCSARVNASFAR